MNLHGFGCGVALEMVRGGAGDPSIIENATNSIKLHGFGGGVGGGGWSQNHRKSAQGLGHLSQNARTTPAQPPHNPCAAEVWEQRTQFQFVCSWWGVCSDLRMLPQALAKVSNIYDFACPGAQNHRFGSSPWKVKSMILLALASKIIDLGICDGG
jgi:hypothetical protein